MHPLRTLLLTGASLVAFAATISSAAAVDLDKIDTVVVIYAENRSFDNIYGTFPGARGLQEVTPQAARQVDRDGKPLAELPAIWEGLTAKGVTPVVTQAKTEHLPNAPFAIDGPKGFDTADSVITRDLWHRFYEEQMQIDGGRNDKFAAFADSGGLVMGNYAHAQQQLWDVAKEYTLADNFFQGAFGGSFLNHFELICACIPRYPDAGNSPAKGLVSKVEPDGVTLTPAANAPGSAMDGPPKFANSSNLTPDFYAVNTMQPPYQPSGNPPTEQSGPAYADPSVATTLPPQHDVTIGDLLSAKGVDWAWYAGAWQAALDGKNAKPVPNFQYHHQPFNYFAQFAPGTPARAAHLRDGGMNGTAFIADIDAGKLPAVTFYKPQGNLNQHAGYASVAAGDAHIADVIAHLQKSPQWGHMLVVLTYDENGGFWDHVAPPRADRWGPGSRIPALIVSPFARKGFVDHTQYDTTSILRFITERWNLPVLPGLIERDDALAAHHQPPMGDLSGALDL
ncbi:acid phosphatase [Ancylobacter mangrovi]|uniref:acid phosphatase n=1 Tax=Ancylobacter mangrovi TaxID=2972472 RepID=UPI002162E740|nr:acid phosphatase [Ancylobacter mangrovi]MCS0503239.1 acid phosphatase [Ancylobacter mangrovi]